MFPSGRRLSTSPSLCPSISDDLRTSRRHAKRPRRRVTGWKRVCENLIDFTLVDSGVLEFFLPVLRVSFMRITRTFHLSLPSAECCCQSLFTVARIKVSRSAAVLVDAYTSSGCLPSERGALVRRSSNRARYVRCARLLDGSIPPHRAQFDRARVHATAPNLVQVTSSEVIALARPGRVTADEQFPLARADEAYDKLKTARCTAAA